jgi:cytochrome P450
LSTLRILRGAVRNPIESWPVDVYRTPLYQSSVLGHRYAFVSGPDLIKQVLVDEAESFVKGVVIRRMLQPALGDAILTAEGAKWRWQRRAVAPMFRQENVQRVVPLMIACAERTRDRWRAHPASADIDIASEMARTTFDIILEAMLAGRDKIDA